jgi:hypothetical protein
MSRSPSHWHRGLARLQLRRAVHWTGSRLPVDSPTPAVIMASSPSRSPVGGPARMTVSPTTRRMTRTPNLKSATYASEPVTVPGAVPDRRGVGVAGARDKITSPSPVTIGGAVAVGLAKSRIQAGGGSSAADSGDRDTHPTAPAVFLSWADAAAGATIVSMPAVPARRTPVQPRAVTAAIQLEVLSLSTSTVPGTSLAVADERGWCIDIRVGVDARASS